MPGEDEELTHVGPGAPCGTHYVYNLIFFATRPITEEERQRSKLEGKGFPKIGVSLAPNLGSHKEEAMKLEAGTIRTNTRWLAVGVLLSLLVLVAGCGSSDPTATPVPPTEEPSAPQLEAWEIEWERLLTAAKGEEVVIQYARGGTTLYEAFNKAFESKFDVRVNASGGDVSRLLAEQQAGQFLADIGFLSANDVVNELVPSGAVEPVLDWVFLPGILDPSNWFAGHLWWEDVETQKYTLVHTGSVNPIVLHVNTDLVNPDDIQALSDIFNYDYAVRIYRGRGATPDLYEYITLGSEFFDRIYLDAAYVLQERDQMVDLLLRGEVGVWYARGAADIAAITELKDAGAPITSIERELGGGVGFLLFTGNSRVQVFKDPPNPNAAKLYLNFLLSKEGQYLRQELAGPTGSLRVDVSHDNIPELFWINPEKDYFTEVDPGVADLNAEVLAAGNRIRVQLGFPPVQ